MGRFCDVINRFRLQTVQVPFHIVAACATPVCEVILASAVPEIYALTENPRRIASVTVVSVLLSIVSFLRVCH